MIWFAFNALRNFDIRGMARQSSGQYLLKQTLQNSLFWWRFQLESPQPGGPRADTAVSHVDIALKPLQLAMLVLDQRPKAPLLCS
jgi:hypothetical protein